MKVTIVGAGNVGASCADVISYRGIASEVVLLDIKEGFAEGKAMDIMQCASNTGLPRIRVAKSLRLHGFLPMMER